MRLPEGRHPRKPPLPLWQRHLRVRRLQVSPRLGVGDARRVGQSSLLLSAVATVDAWAGSANAAATTWPRKTWTGRAVETTPRTFAATAATACVARASARTGRTPTSDTADGSASATTSAATAPATNCAEVRRGRGLRAHARA